MSPYRVLCKDKENKKRLLAAMLSVDKITKRRRIFIIEKTLPEMWNVNMMEVKQLAHNMASRRNSLINAEYAIYKDEVGFKYKVSSRQKDDIRDLEGSHFIQSDCLVAAMNDYLEKENLKIIEQV